MTESFVEHPKTLGELRAGIQAGTTKAEELAAGYYERIAQVNPRLNVYLSLTKERALEQAAKVDAAAAKGESLGVLAGIPMGVKDVLVMGALRRRQGPKFCRATSLPTTRRRWRGWRRRARCCWAS